LWQKGEMTFNVQINTTHQQLKGQKLLIPTIIFYHVDVNSPKYGQIYNIFFGHKCYDMTIGNYPKLIVHVYFVIMSTISLGGCWAWLQFEHLVNESTLRGGWRLLSDCIFFKGPMFKLQPCHYYEGFSQVFCILW